MPGLRGLEWNVPLKAVTVWAVTSLLIQRTLVPTGTVSVAGENLKLAMEIKKTPTFEPGWFGPEALAGAFTPGAFAAGADAAGADAPLALTIMVAFMFGWIMQ